MNEYNDETEITQEQPQQQETQKEINFRLLRERADHEKRRADEAEQRLAAYEREKAERYDDDDFIENKSQVKAMIDPVFKSQDEEIKKLKTMLLNGVIKEYDDYYSVVNDQSIAQLAKTDPDLYDTIANQPDEFKKVTSAYKILKGKNGRSLDYDINARKLEENKLKPRSGAMGGGQVPQSALATLSDSERRVMTKERKQATLALMDDWKSR